MPTAGDPVHPGHLYGVAQGVQTSVDHGTTWVLGASTGGSGTSSSGYAYGDKVINVSGNTHISTFGAYGQTLLSDTLNSLGVGSYIEELAVATNGSGFVVADDTTSAVYHSVDGLAWTATATDLTAGDYYYYVEAGNGGYLVVYTKISTGYISYAKTSPDGITWTNRGALPVISTFFQTMSGYLGGFVVLGYDASNVPQLGKSTDGATWTWQAITATPEPGGLFSMVMSSGNVVFLLSWGGSSTGRIHRSVNGGATWTDVYLGSVLSGSKSYLCYDGLAYYSQIFGVMSLDNGDTWVAIPTPPGAVAWRLTTAVGALVVTIASSYKCFWTTLVGTRQQCEFIPGTALNVLSAAAFNADSCGGAHFVGDVIVTGYRTAVATLTDPTTWGTIVGAPTTSLTVVAQLDWAALPAGMTIQMVLSGQLLGYGAGSADAYVPAAQVVITNHAPIEIIATFPAPLISVTSVGVFITSPSGFNFVDTLTLLSLSV